jgi:hypothetical protein
MNNMTKADREKIDMFAKMDAMAEGVAAKEAAIEQNGKNISWLQPKKPQTDVEVLEKDKLDLELAQKETKKKALFLELAAMVSKQRKAKANAANKKGPNDAGAGSGSSSDSEEVDPSPGLPVTAVGFPGTPAVPFGAGHPYTPPIPGFAHPAAGYPGASYTAAWNGVVRGGRFPQYPTASGSVYVGGYSSTGYPIPGFSMAPHLEKDNNAGTTPTAPFTPLFQHAMAALPGAGNYAAPHDAVHLGCQRNCAASAGDPEADKDGYKTRVHECMKQCAAFARPGMIYNSMDIANPKLVNGNGNPLHMAIDAKRHATTSPYGAIGVPGSTQFASSGHEQCMLKCVKDARAVDIAACFRSCTPYAYAAYSKEASKPEMVSGLPGAVVHPLTVGSHAVSDTLGANTVASGSEVVDTKNGGAPFKSKADPTKAQKKGNEPEVDPSKAANGAQPHIDPALQEGNIKKEAGSESKFKEQKVEMKKVEATAITGAIRHFGSAYGNKKPARASQYKEQREGKHAQQQQKN